MYVRITVNHWKIATDSAAYAAAVERTRDEGLPLLRAQPGFLGYESARIDGERTATITRWESEVQATAGHQRLAEWVRGTGMAEHVASASAFGGEVVLTS